MNEQETSTSPPDTLIGLGPPEPPEKYGEHPADAPETLRGWSTSGKFAVAEEPSIIIRPLPLESLLSGPISRSDESEASTETLSFRQPAARSVLFWSAPVVLTAIAIASSTAFSGTHQEPAAASHAVPIRPLTTRLVGGPWVLRHDVSQDPQEESTEPARIFYREPHARPHRTTPRPSTPPPGETPRAEAELARDHARVQAVADAVELEDEVPEAEAVKPEEPAQP